jgi:hypothetical protein
LASIPCVHFGMGNISIPSDVRVVFFVCFRYGASVGGMVGDLLLGSRVFMFFYCLYCGLGSVW